jgi:hypothetical protein
MAMHKVGLRPGSLGFAGLKSLVSTLVCECFASPMFTVIRNDVLLNAVNNEYSQTKGQLGKAAKPLKNKNNTGSRQTGMRIDRSLGTGPFAHRYLTRL